MLGDATSSGGQVISGSPFTDVDGQPVARVNDKATCPAHKGTFPIVDGVKLHNHGYWLLLGFQPDNTATAPNGEIYLPADLFSPDFSLEGLGRQHLPVHEMTHVWQCQLGYPIKRVRGPRPNMSYAYTLEPQKRLCDYNMEAQGNLVADYFLLQFRNAKREMSEPGYAFMRGDPKPLYQMVLRDFLADPADKAKLPKVTE